MPDFEEIYAYHAEAYDALIEREDYQGHLLPALAQIAPLEGARGRVRGRHRTADTPTGAARPAYPRLRRLPAHARRYRVPPESDGRHQLGIGCGRQQAPAGRGRRCRHRDCRLDLRHAVDWFADSWRGEIGAAVDEMMRVLRPGGTAIILETMTTGSEPAPPTEGLATYYRWLETERGFSETTIRTDYKFESLEEADRLTRFFFGDGTADRVRRENSVVVPENTDIWWRQRE